MEARLKFRIWNPRYNEFNYWGFDEHGFKGPPTGSGFSIQDCSKSDRLTGRQDSKGEDVYEGDVWQRGDFLGVIKFEYGGWQIMTHELSGNIQYPSFYSNVNTGEVIGHIYDPKYSELNK